MYSASNHELSEITEKNPGQRGRILKLYNAMDKNQVSTDGYLFGAIYIQGRTKEKNEWIDRKIRGNLSKHIENEVASLSEVYGYVIQGNDLAEIRLSVQILRQITDKDIIVIVCGIDAAVSALVFDSINISAIGAKLDDLSKTINFWRGMRPYTKLPFVCLLNDSEIGISLDYQYLSLLADEYDVKWWIERFPGTVTRSNRQLVNGLNNNAMASSKKAIFTIGDPPLLISGGLDCLVRPHAMKKFSNTSWEQRYPLLIEEMELASQIGATGISISIPTLGSVEGAMMRALTSFTNKYPNFIWVINVGHSPVTVLVDALEMFQGKAIVNFSTMEKKRLAVILPIIKDTGSNVVIQVLDDHGMPETTSNKIAMTECALDFIENMNIPLHNILIDPLAPYLGSNPSSIASTIEYMQWLGVMGLRSASWVTNVSLGMKEREEINSAYVNLLVAFGLDVAVLDPYENKTIQAFNYAIN